MDPAEIADDPEIESYRVHWAVFLPTVAIAVLYSGVWLWFALGNGSIGGVSQAALLVLAVGVPLLLVHAGIRYANGRLHLGPDELVACPGWPVRRERHVAYSHIAQIHLRRGLIGRVAGVGSLVIVDRNGDHTVMPDLAEPEAVLAAIRAKCSQS